jgi:hypothetical protein
MRILGRVAAGSRDVTVSAVVQDGGVPVDGVTVGSALGPIVVLALNHRISGAAYAATCANA